MKFCMHVNAYLHAYARSKRVNIQRISTARQIGAVNVGLFFLDPDETAPKREGAVRKWLTLFSIPFVLF